MRVLVVDDHEELLELVQRALVRDAYEVAVATSGQQALLCLKAQPADIVILDLGLPDMSGEALCTMLRKRGGRRRAE